MKRRILTDSNDSKKKIVGHAYFSDIPTLISNSVGARKRKSFSLIINKKRI